jgi:nucleoside-triphosphatase
VGVAAIEVAIEGSALIVMDEIGRMELCSELFQQAVMRALDSGTPVFGTVQDRRNAFLDAVRDRRDVEVVRVDERNRDGLVEELTARVAAMLRCARSGSTTPGAPSEVEAPENGADL